MIYLVYAIYDKATHRFSQPMIFETAESALRQIRVSSSVDKTLACCPEDFELYDLGSYDTTNGVISCGKPTFCSSLADVLRDDCEREVRNEVQ